MTIAIPNICICLLVFELGRTHDMSLDNSHDVDSKTSLKFSFQELSERQGMELTVNISVNLFFLVFTRDRTWGRLVNCLCS